MSEYRKKLDGFSWPSHLNQKIRWLARDRAFTSSGGNWFGFLNKPNIENGYWYASDLSDSLYGIDVSVLVLPEGCDPLLLFRDDYETPAAPTGTESRVCDDIARRQQLGIAKYGVSVANNPLTHLQWLRHAYEEALDFAIYLRRAIETHEAVQLDQSKPSSS